MRCCAMPGSGRRARLGPLRHEANAYAASVLRWRHAVVAEGVFERQFDAYRLGGTATLGPWPAPTPRIGPRSRNASRPAVAACSWGATAKIGRASCRERG